MRRAALAFAFLSTTMPAVAQDTGGRIDTRAAIERRIYELEGMISGDVSPERQAVALRWLADLYLSVDRADDAEAAYQRILVFYPYDASCSNAYAEFLLDTRDDPERALEVTRAAIAWAKSMDSPPLYLGETYAIRARAFAKADQCENALHAADQAVTLSEEDASEDARRTSARCLSALGNDAESKKVLLGVIGDTGASNPDDESALVALMTKSKKQVDAREVDRAIAAAVEDSRKRRAESIAREHAVMVELAPEPGVRVEGTLRPAKGKSAVLFVPDLGGRRTAYRPYAQLFTLDNFTTLTLDPRGHGNSRSDSLPSFRTMPEHHRQEVSADVAAAVDYLVDQRGIDAGRVIIVAAGRACSVVERAIHEHNLDAAVVYLSPIFAEDDRDLASAVSFRPPRPALVLASAEDLYAVKSLRAFESALGSDAVRTKIYPAAGHGVSLLRDPAHFADVDAWVKEIAASPSARE